MSARSVVEHALTVYYDGNAELARQVADQFAASERAEEAQRAAEPAAELADACVLGPA